MSARALVGGSLVAAVALVVVSLALGGASYAPAGVRDPCQPHAWQSGGGLDQTAQEITLSALDGAACELHVTRETLVLSLATPAGRRAFADDPRLAAAIRSGLTRAIDDADAAGAIPGLVATGLRELAANAPIDELIATVRNAGALLDQLNISPSSLPDIFG